MPDGWTEFETPAGRGLMERAVRIHAEVVELMTERLDAAQVEAMGEIMRTVGARIDEALVPPPKRAAGNA